MLIKIFALLFSILLLFIIANLFIDWTIIFNASANNLEDSTAFTPTYITNLNTGIQYKWDGANWLLSFEGEYRKGTWNISL